MHAADAQRQETLQALSSQQGFDAIIIGGGATGVGIALDAALRGYKVALVERGDFAQGTSSRSSKLLHGGVRYLEQGDFSLVYEALHERGNLLANAPHIAQPLSFVLPAFKLWHMPFYGIGLKAYDALAGKAGIGASHWIGPKSVQNMLPTVRLQGLLGGVSYWDAQFDDARLAITIARTAQHHGAVLANYCEVRSVLGDAGATAGVEVVDRESGRVFKIRSRCVINAAGVWVDQLRRTASHQGEQRVVTPSQGVHLSFDRSLLPGTSALFWPRTRDGRVLFAIPWLGKTIVGTTDSARTDVPHEPSPLPGEVDYLLRECADFFDVPPKKSDILSTWVGLRPLVNTGLEGSAQDTKSISREHTVLTSADGFVTVTGGKWTTYRSMAQDVLDQCIDAGLLPLGRPCVTATTPLLGADCIGTPSLGNAFGMHSYGSEADRVNELPGAGRLLAPDLTEAMVRFAVRHEFSRTVEDVLARRNRLLFLDAKAAQQSMSAVADVIESETTAPIRREAFHNLAARYMEPGL
jgi:glycerol-3-phosphate dehydrogenase